MNSGAFDPITHILPTNSTPPTSKRTTAVMRNREESGTGGKNKHLSVPITSTHLNTSIRLYGPQINLPVEPSVSVCLHCHTLSSLPVNPTFRSWIIVGKQLGRATDASQCIRQTSCPNRTPALCLKAWACKMIQMLLNYWHWDLWDFWHVTGINPFSGGALTAKHSTAWMNDTLRPQTGCVFMKP